MVRPCIIRHIYFDEWCISDVDMYRFTYWHLAFFEMLYFLTYTKNTKNEK